MNVQELPYPVQEQQVVPVNQPNELQAFQPGDVAFAAERILMDAAPQTETPAAEQSQNVEFDPGLLQMFMFLGRMGASDEVKAAVSGALAMDVVGKAHGIEEFTLDNARVQNAHAAQMAAAEQARLAEEAEEDEEDL